MLHKFCRKWLAAGIAAVTCLTSMASLGASMAAMTASAEESGTCGENLTWVLDDDGVLTISGEGEMEDYYSISVVFPLRQPWEDERESIVKVVIEDGVTSIGECAFSSCINLSEITIPDSVTHIGWRAFNGTAWYDNQSDGVVYAGKVAYCYKGDMPENAEIIIKDGTLGIASSAFQGPDDYTSTLVSVTISDSVTYIGDFAFGYCTSLTEITIPNSVTYIGDAAFYRSGLTSIIIPDSVLEVGNGLFGGCKSLMSVTLSSNIRSLSALDLYGYDIKGFFQYCTSLKEITIPKNVASIGAYAFSYCDSLTEITILNPECEIYDGNSAIPDTATIYGYDNSTAQTYAETYDRTFVSLGEASAAESLSSGDLDGDNDVTLNDAFLALMAYANHAVGKDYDLTDAQFTAADVDKDGDVTLNDAYVILCYYANHAVGKDVTWEELL